jgi:hypothetical protein
VVEVEDLPSIAWRTSEEECTTRAAQELATREENMAANMLSVAPLAGTWVDGVGDERVELVVDAKGAGTIVWGDPSKFPEIGDPARPFLVSSDVPDGTGIRDRRVRMVPSFRYALIPKTGRASEMSFVLDRFAPWGEWCSLQPPIRNDNCYSCEYELGGGSAYLGEECGERRGCYVMYGRLHLQVDCGRAELCASQVGVCSCTKDECVDRGEPSLRYTAMLDPVDTSVLRLVAEGGMEPTRYLARAE